MIEGISADNCGRSFMIRVPTSDEPFYFWCSEKSKLLGNELLDKVGIVFCELHTNVSATVLQTY